MKDGISFHFASEHQEKVIIGKLHDNIQKGVHLAAMMYSEKYLSKLWKCNNDRELAILRMLSLEILVDDMLSIWIKGYESELKGRTQSFYYKISLLKSLNLIPSKILDAYLYYNKVRNKFAHELDIENYDTLIEKYSGLLNEFRNLIRRFNPDYELTEIKNDLNIFFPTLVISSTMYLYHIKILSNTLFESNLLEQIQLNTNLPDIKQSGIDEDGNILISSIDPLK